MKLVVLCVGAMAAIGAIAEDVWPDGTEIGPWFGKAEPVDVATLGKAYRFDDNGIFPDGKVRTREIQSLRSWGHTPPRACKSGFDAAV